jgi:hypothetical protein
MTHCKPRHITDCKPICIGGYVCAPLTYFSVESFAVTDICVNTHTHTHTHTHTSLYNNLKHALNNERACGFVAIRRLFMCLCRRCADGAYTLANT